MPAAARSAVRRATSILNFSSRRRADRFRANYPAGRDLDARLGWPRLASLCSVRRTVSALAASRAVATPYVFSQSAIPVSPSAPDSSALATADITASARTSAFCFILLPPGFPTEIFVGSTRLPWNPDLRCCARAGRAMRIRIRSSSCGLRRRQRAGHRGRRQPPVQTSATAHNGRVGVA